jgi:hypothetical protein
MATSRSHPEAVRKQVEPETAACAGTAGEGEREPVWAPVEPADRAAAYRVACRLFRGFDLLPDAVVETMYGFPFFFVARRGMLTLREREIIARAITGEPPGAFGNDPRAVEDEEAFVILRAAPSIRDGAACKALRAGFDSREEPVSAHRGEAVGPARDAGGFRTPAAPGRRGATGARIPWGGAWPMRDRSPRPASLPRSSAWAVATP